MGTSLGVYHINDEMSQWEVFSNNLPNVPVTDIEINTEENSITVGNISVSETLDAKIDLDKLISRHCAIVGSTGSGKSNSVSVLLQSIANRNFLHASFLLCLDPVGLP